MYTIIFKIVNVNKFVSPCELYATFEDCVFMCHFEVTCYFSSLSTYIVQSCQLTLVYLIHRQLVTLFSKLHFRSWF
jgi:hypothetical protein